jgi:hypothetical protein
MGAARSFGFSRWIGHGIIVHGFRSGAQAPVSE